MVTKEKTSKYQEFLNTAGKIEFDIFSFAKAVGHARVLPLLSFDSFEKCGVMHLVDPHGSCPHTEKFLDKIQATYNAHVPYHNDLHGADVLQMSRVLVE